jgi:hypothetical protein
MPANRDLSFDDIKARGAITLADVMRLRRDFFADGIVAAEEAEALFSLNDACPVQDTAWAPFFVEALSDFLVHQMQPAGYVTKDNADWLLARIAVDGHVSSATELELLINVIDKARWAPASLAAFALGEVKRAIVTGEGPVLAGKQSPAGSVGAAETELLRRILYAFGSDGGIAITRAEAEVLFDINDATAGGDNSIEWTDLFTKAVANFLMAASGYAAPSREEALRREAWLDSRDTATGFLSKMVAGGFRAVIDAYRTQSVEEQQLAGLERQKIEIITAERISGAEAEWLAARIGRNGRLEPAETALLTFIKRESPEIHPALRPLLDKVA